MASVYGAVATPSELTIVTDLVKRGPLRSVLDDKSKRESLTAATRHRIIKVILWVRYELGFYYLTIKIRLSHVFFLLYSFVMVVITAVDFAHTL